MSNRNIHKNANIRYKPQRLSRLSRLSTCNKTKKCKTSEWLYKGTSSVAYKGNTVDDNKDNNKDNKIKNYDMYYTKKTISVIKNLQLKELFIVKDYINSLININVPFPVCTMTCESVYGKASRIITYDVNKIEKMVKIYEFILNVWKSTKTVIISKHILDNIMLLLKENNFVLPYNAIIKYGFLFVEKFETFAQSEQDINNIMMKLFMCLIKDDAIYDNNINKLLQVCFKRKNMPCIAAIMKHLTKDHLKELVMCLSKNNKYSDYIIDNYMNYIFENTLDTDMWWSSKYTNIMITIMTLYDDKHKQIISRICRKFIGYLLDKYDAYDNMFRVMNVMQSYNNQNLYIFSDILFDVMVKRNMDVDTIIMLFNEDRYKTSSKYRSRLISFSESKPYVDFFNIIKIKRQFLTITGIDIVYPSKVNYYIITLLLLIAKVDKYKKIGLKHIIKTIIGYYYNIL